MAQIQVSTLLAPIAQMCRGCNTTTMTEAYVHAVRDLCARSKVYTSSLAGTATIDEDSYNLGSDAYNEIIGVRAVSVTVASDDIRGLTEKSSSEWDPGDASDVPEFFQYVPEGQLAIHPKPDSAYPLTITLVLQPKRGVNSIDDALVVRWESAFRCGALAYLLGLPGMDWTDKNESLRQAAAFERWIVTAGAAAERRYRLRVLNSNY